MSVRSIYKARRRRGGLVIIVGMTAAICMALYPIMIYPRLYPEVYREKQKKSRDRSLEETQPGGMKVWSDPFDRKKK